MEGSSPDAFIVQSFPVEIRVFDILFIAATVMGIGYLSSRFPIRYITKRYLPDETKECNMPYDIITILGPTACGKTKLAAELCYQINGEIIVRIAASLQKNGYRTGKDLTDYVVQGKSIRFILLTCWSRVKNIMCLGLKPIFTMHMKKSKTNAVPVLCGGSGMYLEAVLRNYNLLEVPENKELREELEKYSLEELTQRLSQYKRMHNKTDVDTKKELFVQLK
jgi:tRNA dimethylallyltransferase